MRVTKAFSITTMILGFIAGLLALQITIEKLDLLKNPHYHPSCSINPFISCGPILASWQSSLFGFPNSLIGIVGFGLVTLIGFTSLVATMPRWYWVCHTIGITLAMTFIIWLQTQSALSIRALCLYCFGVWLTMIPLFWLAIGNIAKGTRFNFLNTYKPIIMFTHYVVLLFLMFLAFQQGWLAILHSL